MKQPDKAQNVIAVKEANADCMDIVDTCAKHLSMDNVILCYILQLKELS